jgi:hypothetical protein
MSNYKTYIIIDYTNSKYGFVNNPSEVNKFYTDLNIDIASLPADGNNVLTEAVLVNLKTKEQLPIKYTEGAKLCIQ